MISFPIIPSGLLTAIATLLCTLIPPVVAQTGPGGPDGGAAAVDAATREQVIRVAIARLKEAYVLPDVADRMEADLKRRLAAREYDRVTSAPDFAEKLAADLRSVSRDLHLQVIHDPNGLALPEKDAAGNVRITPADRRRGALINFGFERLERLRGNIGYLKLRGFAPPAIGGETAAAAMNFLANTDALIVDLRENGGGDPSMVALLLSYLFDPEPVHLNDIYTRIGERTQQYWTLPYVPGQRYGVGKPVFVLTSRHTVSAAEEYAYNLKTLKRGTVVGEVTAGGANPSELFRLTDHFGIFVPTGRAVNPITKTNWEGTGVTPDIVVPASDALRIAQIEALSRLQSVETDENLKRQLGQRADELRKMPATN